MLVKEVDENEKEDDEGEERKMLGIDKINREYLLVIEGRFEDNFLTAFELWRW